MLVSGRGWAEKEAAHPRVSMSPAAAAAAGSFSRAMAGRCSDGGKGRVSTLSPGLFAGGRGGASASDEAGRREQKPDARVAKGVDSKNAGGKQLGALAQRRKGLGCQSTDYRKGIGAHCCCGVRQRGIPVLPVRSALGSSCVTRLLASQSSWSTRWPPLYWVLVLQRTA